MWDRILHRMRGRLRRQDPKATSHAGGEMINDRLTIEDLKSAIHKGKIVARQRDRMTKRWKYRIQGPAKGGAPIEVVAKLDSQGDVVVVTCYRLS